jgi:NAD(P)-dependent dehydrogenase (short-subunit alcohol dehydrogenase family)
MMLMADLPKLFDLHDRVALVTGGAGLLGEEFCHTLGEAGARVVVADINSQATDRLVNILHTDGIDAIGVEVDVTDVNSVSRMLEGTLEVFQRLDILVNCAALDPKFDPQHSGHTNSFENYPLEAWNQALAVNLTGIFLCCQAAARPMLSQGKGVIINLSSIYGITAPDQRLYHSPNEEPQFKPAYYPVTKGGILAFTGYLAAYYTGRNIRVNAISPGGVYNGHDEQFVKAYAARTMLGRMAYKDDMNGALLYLASDASAYVTGANLVVDGGWSAW